CWRVQRKRHLRINGGDKTGVLSWSNLFLHSRGRSFMVGWDLRGAPPVVDVRPPADFATAGVLIVSAYHRDPDKVEQWRRDLPNGRQVVVHCVHGHEVSQSVATALRAAGVDAVYLQDGIAGWTAKGLPTHRT